MITRLAIYAAAVTKLLLFALALSVIIYCCLYAVGTKCIKKDYEKDYKALERAVRHWKNTPRNYTRTRNMIIKIRKYGCRDKERIDVLTTEFHRRYNKKFINYRFKVPACGSRGRKKE